MRALVCEMCNSNDVVKQDGYFVCQNCGTKYSVEEARKSMFEGPVVIDETAKIGNYYKLAESAIEAGNNKEAKDYCNKILEIDINHWEAWLLKGKTVLGKSTLEEAFSYFTKALDNAPEECIDDLRVDIANEVVEFTIDILSLRCDNFSSLPSEDNANAIIENVNTVILYSIEFLLKCMVETDRYQKNVANKIDCAVVKAWNECISKEYYEDSHPSGDKYHRFVKGAYLCIEITRLSIILCGENYEANIQRYKNMIGYTHAIIDARAWKRTSNGNGYYVDNTNMIPKEAVTLSIDNIMEYHYKIKEIDPNYVVPERPKPKPSGCYIATCVYGSYNCPQVWTLRRFRDFTLAKTWYGRAFIKIYYTVSPTLVKLFGNTKWFKKLWKGGLDRLIKSLKEKGFKDTAYYDR